MSISPVQPESQVWGPKIFIASCLILAVACVTVGIALNPVFVLIAGCFLLPLILAGPFLARIISEAHAGRTEGCCPLWPVRCQILRVPQHTNSLQ